MISDFIFRQQENLVDNQKCQAGFSPLRNKIAFIPNIIEFYKLSREAGSEVPITYIPCVLQICP